MSDGPFKHLSDGARAALALPPEKRVEYVKRKHWIPYPVATAAEKKLLELMNHPKVERMPCALIVGESNNGKSSLLTHFCLKHSPVVAKPGTPLQLPAMAKAGAAIQIPALMISAPTYANEAEFLVNIVKAFGVPHNPNDKPLKLFDQALRLLITYKVLLLLIDEFNLISVGTSSDQRKVLNRVRMVSKHAGVPIVAAGTRQAISLLSHESQFANRFEPFPLRKWSADQEDTLNLLATIENGLPFPEPSDLDGDELASLIVSAAEGTIGGMLELTARMSEYAITHSKPKLTKDLIKTCGWIPYSKRAHIADDLL